MSIAAIVISVLGAVIAGWAAWSAHKSALSADRSADEANKLRLDQLGPNIFIEDPEPLRERWQVGPAGDRHPPGLTQPGITAYDTPGGDDIRVLVGAILTVRNQGVASARISMAGAYRLDDPLALDTAELDRLSQIGQIPDTRLPPDGITLGPGDSMRVVVRTGPTVREWAHNGDLPYRVLVRAETSPDAAAQEWELILTAPLLNRNISNASRFDVLPHILIGADLEPRPRRYPVARERKRLFGRPSPVRHRKRETGGDPLPLLNRCDRRGT